MFSRLLSHTICCLGYVTQYVEMWRSSYLPRCESTISPAPDLFFVRFMHWIVEVLHLFLVFLWFSFMLSRNFICIFSHLSQRADLNMEPLSRLSTVLSNSFCKKEREGELCVFFKSVAAYLFCLL